MCIRDRYRRDLFHRDHSSKVTTEFDDNDSAESFEGLDILVASYSILCTIKYMELISQ